MRKMTFTLGLMLVVSLMSAPESLFADNDIDDPRASTFVENHYEIGGFLKWLGGSNSTLAKVFGGQLAHKDARTKKLLDDAKENGLDVIKDALRNGNAGNRPNSGSRPRAPRAGNSPRRPRR